MKMHYMNVAFYAGRYTYNTDIPRWPWQLNGWITRLVIAKSARPHPRDIAVFISLIYCHVNLLSQPVTSELF